MRSLGSALAVLLACWTACSPPEPAGDDPADPGITRVDLDPGPALVPPDRSGLDHDLFVVTSGASGRSFRIRMGPDRAPLIAGASQATFYDGKALVRFGRLAVERSEELGGGRTYHQTRLRLWEEDGLGTGRWVHNHGLLSLLDVDPDGVCEPGDVCRWDESSGMDLVSIVGDLRGIRVWSGGYTGGDHGTASARYVIHDRFGEQQDFLKLYGATHRDLVRAARAAWNALPEESRSCHEFDYKSSYLRPSPGGLVWVMHGTAAFDACRGTTLAVEVPAPAPLYGNVDVSTHGDPGETFHFGPPDVWIDPGPVVRGEGWTLRLPAGTGEDPPLAAVHWMAESDIRLAHLQPLDAAFTSVNAVPLCKGKAPVVDGRLDEWKGSTLLLLDQLDNIPWQRASDPWAGAADASLGVGLRAVPEGWVLAARALDDVRTLGDGPAADQLQVWLRGQDGWFRLAVLPGDEPGEARVIPTSMARMGGLEEAIPPAAAAALEGARASWRVLHDADGDYRGMDFEVLLPAPAARLDEGQLGLRVLFADGDGGDALQGDTLVGNAAPLVDAWTRVQDPR